MAGQGDNPAYLKDHPHADKAIEKRHDKIPQAIHSHLARCWFVDPVFGEQCELVWHGDRKSMHFIMTGDGTIGASDGRAG